MQSVGIALTTVSLLACMVLMLAAKVVAMIPAMPV